ncbi:MAG: hypothetical protein WCL00_00280 [Bacteroidota bacterium]
MGNNIETAGPLPKKTRRRSLFRALLLKIVCLFSFVFFGIILLLCLAGLLGSAWISEVITQYLPKGSTYSQGTVVLIAGLGFLLHAVAFFGVVGIWSKKRQGYRIFSIASFLIALIFLFSDKISLPTTGVYIFLVIFFGLYYRRFH